MFESAKDKFKKIGYNFPNIVIFWVIISCCLASANQSFISLPKMKSESSF